MSLRLLTHNVSFQVSLQWYQLGAWNRPQCDIYTTEIVKCYGKCWPTHHCLWLTSCLPEPFILSPLLSSGLRVLLLLLHMWKGLPLYIPLFWVKKCDSGIYYLLKEGQQRTWTLKTIILILWLLSCFPNPIFIITKRTHLSQDSKLFQIPN